jgi:hypothetical protein
MGLFRDTNMQHGHTTMNYTHSRTHTQVREYRMFLTCIMMRARFFVCISYVYVYHLR